MMTTRYPSSDDQPLVHQYIRRFGRRPTPEELRSYGASQPPAHEAVRIRLRHRLARVILRG
jgi:hypothetical protein